MGARPRGLKVGNRVLLALAALALVALPSLGFVSTAPNRLADGVPLAFWHAPPLLAASVAALSVALALLGLGAPARLHDWAALTLAGLLAFALLVAAASLARSQTVPGHLAQRLALGPGFWCTFALACLMAVDAIQRLRLSLAARGATLLLVLATFGTLAATGVFDALSLARELASHRALFLAALVRHALLVGAALLLSLVVCAPLVVLVRRGPRQSTLVYAVLGLVQTIPSIALFGLLIAPLTFLAEHVAVLRAIGLAGLGVTPALIALVLYAAFPLVRMSDAALSAVPPEVADAATGLGFSRLQRFLAVDLPLALPVLLSGLRVVTMQAIGLATVAALIGGGGLGAFIFEGIGEYALDLVLVGAVPVILLALLADFAFRIVQAGVEVRA